MVRTFTGNCPPRGNMDEQDNTQLLESDLNDFQPMPRNLFVGGAEQEQSNTSDDERTPTRYAIQPEEQFHVPAEAKRRHPRQNASRLERSMEAARTSELEERTRVLEMAIGKILSRLIPDDPLIPFLNRGEQPATKEIKRTAIELMQVHQRERETLQDYMQRFNKATLDIDNVPDTICLSALLHGLKPGRFLDDLLENPPKSWNEVNDRSTSFILSEDFQSFKRRANDKQSNEHKQPEIREEKKKQKVGEQKGKPPSFPRYANYIPLSSLRSQMLAQIQHWVKRPPPQTHEYLGADRSKYYDYHRGYGHNTDDCQSLKDELEFLACNGKLEGYVQKPYAQQPNQTHFVYEYSRSQGQGQGYQLGQGQKPSAQHPKDHKGVGYRGIPPPSSTINMISGGMHSGGQSARGRKTYARQVMTVDKNRPLKRPFEEAEWENTPITFSPADYKRTREEPDIMMPHADPFVAPVHIGNHNVNKVFIDTGSSPDILYWSCFQKMQLNPASMHRYEGPIYGFDNQPVQVERVITLPIYVGTEPRFRMASVSFLVVKMESAYNAIIGRATLCKLKAVISQPHHEMPGISTELAVHKLSTNPTRRPVVQKRRLMGLEKQAAIDEEIQKLLQAGFIRRVNYSQWVSNPVLVKKPNGKWRMCIDFTNLNETCPKDPHALPNVEKLVERAAGHKRLSFLDASSSVRAEDHIDDLNETFQNLRRAQMRLNPLKCTFVVESGKFLGYVVSKKGIEVNPDKFVAVQQMEPPKTVKYVQRLTGRLAAPHRFIARSAEKCLPFFRALREPKSFQWTNECQQGFDELKQYLASPPLLSKPVEGERLYLYLGTTDEAAAFELVCIARKLMAYFQSHEIIVYTDLPLKKILQKPELSGRLIRWAIELSEYDLKFQPRTAIKDGAASVEGSGARTVLICPNGLKSEHALRFSFKTTNNTVEYEELIYGLKLVSVLKAQHIRVFSDFQLIVNQVNGSCDVRDPQLSRHAPVVSNMKANFTSFRIDKIPRADNRRADELSKLASLQDINPHRTTVVEILDAPSYIDLGDECLVLSTYPSSLSWTTPLINYLRNVAQPNRLCTGLVFPDESLSIMDLNFELRPSGRFVMIMTHVLAAHSNWVDELNKVLWSCRTTPNSAIGETPFSLACGTEVVLPVEVGLSTNQSARHDHPDNEQFLRENLDLVEEVREASRIKNMVYQGRVARFYNKRVRARQFQVGDLVLRKVGLTNAYSHMGKLAPNWEGPCMVTQIKRPGSYILADSQGRRLPFTLNVHNLRKYYS
ncbi:hypothetical protein SLEP1_g54277 [Rubroshorea leprosula]|uniref:RNase H type-1 domain-containing protein n=1 Tax=Rubroshorea leprosula TaxID=152421 RepID=A0AAV5MD04_9ROSI|nr:hypothetical protein SLEP1_g54277 [Rubroshorea leprosula]